MSVIERDRLAALLADLVSTMQMREISGTMYALPTARFLKADL